MSDITLPLHINNVVGLELMRAWVPRGEYVINDHNQWLDFRTIDGTTVSDGTDGATVSVSLDMGDGWSARNVVSCLQQHLRDMDIVGLKCVHVELLLRTSQVRFRNPTPFTLAFGTGPNSSKCMAEILGFPHGEDVSSRACCDSDNDDGCCFEITAPFRMNLSGVRYLEVRTDEMALEHTDGVLAQIAMSPQLPVVHYSAQDIIANMRMIRYPVVLRELKLTFTTRDTMGIPRPYDFNGMYYNITLAVYALRQNIPWKPIVEGRV